MNACKHPLYAERYQRTKRRLGRQRGPKVAQIELSRKLTEAIWHMLTRNQPFAPVITDDRPHRSRAIRLMSYGARVRSRPQRPGWAARMPLTGGPASI